MIKMLTLTDLRDDITEYIDKHGLSRKWEKAKTLFEKDPFYPSLNTELLEPKHRLIYSFRIDRQYRALFVYLSNDRVEILTITNHYRK